MLEGLVSPCQRLRCPVGVVLRATLHVCATCQSRRHALHAICTCCIQKQIMLSRILVLHLPDSLPRGLGAHVSRFVGLRCFTEQRQRRRPEILPNRRRHRCCRLHIGGRVFIRATIGFVKVQIVQKMTRIDRAYKV